MATISIAMATFNGERFIREQLASIASQTILPIELVISDDGSTDRTIEIAREFATTAPFLTRIHQNEQRLGYKANFLKCASLCTGDLIAFADQDDIWFPYKLERQSLFFSDPDMMMVHHNARLISASGDDLGELWTHLKQEPIAMWMALPPWFNVPGFSQLFRREIAAANFAWPSSVSAEKPDQTLVHDQWVTFMSNSLGKVGYINEPLVKYRQHEQNALGWNPVEQTILKRMQYWLENRTEIYQRAETSAGQKSSSLLAVQERLPEIRQVAAQTAAARWIDLEKAYRERRLLYSGTLLIRIRALRYLVSIGAYGERAFWTFSQKAFIKDFILGLVFGTITARYGFKPDSGSDSKCRRGYISSAQLGRLEVSAQRYWNSHDEPPSFATSESEQN
jgi:glycosyltransferase involved in cell wall biosynthesis